MPDHDPPEITNPPIPSDNGAGGPGRPPEPRPVHVEVMTDPGQISLMLDGTRFRAGEDRVAALLFTGGSEPVLAVAMRDLPGLILSMGRYVAGPGSLDDAIQRGLDRAFGPDPEAN